MILAHQYKTFLNHSQNISAKQTLKVNVGTIKILAKIRFMEANQHMYCSAIQLQKLLTFNYNVLWKEVLKRVQFVLKLF